VRRRPAVVRAVEPYRHPTMEETHLVQVEYIDDWKHPDHDSLIWELERDKKVSRALMMPPLKADPAQAELFEAFLHAYQWGAINRLNASRGGEEEEVRLISPWHSAVEVEEYQLYPVLKALLMPRISMLIADDVGLGKTVEAGLIMSELLVRRRIRRILIVCPAALQLQWRDEMREKFHLDFTIVDRDATFRLQREMGIDSNPWASYPRIITSMDYLRQKDILTAFHAATRTISGHFDAILPWQMLVVDEAHNLAPHSFGDQSQRCRMLREISPYFEHRIFLSATPHNGYTFSFTGLLELLDPVRFQQKASLDEHDRAQLGLTMVRRLKGELEEAHIKTFLPRHVERLSVKLYSTEKTLFDALRGYRVALRQLLFSLEKKQERHLGEFLIKILTKRLLSSSYAFARTWWRHVEGLETREEDLTVISHVIARAQAPDLNDDQERSQREEDAVKQTGAWARRYATQLKTYRDVVSRCLEQLGWSKTTIELVQQDWQSLSTLPVDARWEALERWIDETLYVDGKLRDDERLLIFTEYKDTLDYLLERLRRKGLTNPVVEHLYGGVSIKQRQQVKDAFNDPQDPVRILVGTDTLAEGISLQLTCRYIIHQDIPWNPMRLEQRNGRLDRHGQRREVFTYHFYSDDEEDLNFMAFIVDKVKQTRNDLGSVGQVIDSALEQYFTGGLSRTAFDALVEEKRQETHEEDDLKERDSGGRFQIEKAYDRLKATQLELKLTSDHVRQLLERAVSFEKGRLVPDAGDPHVYRFATVPPSWKQLVKETLRQERAGVTGNAGMVFDPAYFDVHTAYQHNNTRVLIRLGHPLMQRALAVLRRALWEDEQGERVSRWTVRGCTLPHGAPPLLILYLLVEVTNEFHEIAHQEVLLLPRRFRDDRLSELDAHLWREVQPLRRYPLTGQELGQWIEKIRHHWPAHEQQILSLVRQKREELQQLYAGLMDQRLQEEEKEERRVFDERLKELERYQNPHEIERIRRQEEKLNKELQQLENPSLFADIEMERMERRTQLEQQRQELYYQQAYSHLALMKQLVERERERILQKVLPKRYALAAVDVQPLALEYIVPLVGREEDA
jgi:hypothetical protein